MGPRAHHPLVKGPSKFTRIQTSLPYMRMVLRSAVTCGLRPGWSTIGHIKFKRAETSRAGPFRLYPEPSEH
eukprot:4239501-Amphidinium_carterae.4